MKSTEKQRAHFNMLKCSGSQFVILKGGDNLSLPFGEYKTFFSTIRNFQIVQKCLKEQLLGNA